MGVAGVDSEFVRRHSVDITLAAGGRVRIRPILPDDKARLAEGLRRLSPESRYRRFFSATTKMSERALTYLTEIDYDDHFAWGALDLEQPGHPGVGVARYIRLRGDPEAAEVAVAVADDYHGRGIGTLLLETVAITAREHGIRRLVANVLADNRPVQALLREVGAVVRWDSAAGCLQAELPVPERSVEIRDTPLYEVLRAAARGEVDFPAGQADPHPQQG